MKFMRSKFLMGNYRRLQSHMNELLDNPRESLVRAKRSFLFDRMQSSHRFFKNKRRYTMGNRNAHKRVSRTLSDVIYRQLRKPFQGEEAYAKYLAKIKQKYQKYVKNILGYNNIRNYSAESVGIESPILANDDTSDFVHRPVVDYSTTQNIDETINSHSHFDSNIFPILQKSQSAFNFNYHPSKKQKTINSTTSTYFELENDLFNQHHYKIIKNNYLKNSDFKDTHALHATGMHSHNVSEIIAKLNAQIVRKKRSISDVDDEKEMATRKANRRTNMNNYTSFMSDGEGVTAARSAIDENADAAKRGKPKSPCEVCVFSNTQKNIIFQFCFLFKASGP